MTSFVFWLVLANIYMAAALASEKGGEIAFIIALILFCIAGCS